MAKILLNYSQIYEIASNISTNRENISTEYETITTTVNSLVDNGYMSAETATAYVNQFTTMLGPAIEELLELLQVYSNNLVATADNFQRIDHTIADSLGY